MKTLIRLACCTALLTFSTANFAQSYSLRDCAMTESQIEDSEIEHLWGGAPDHSNVYARRGYVMAYNSDWLVPHWAAWRAVDEYRDTPKRKSRWSSFRRDEHDDLDAVHSDDYIGWYDSDENFARGHIVPYFISGGDRDDDGRDAEYEDSLRVEDIDDACTVFEINSMANIAPQYHDRFNGQPGVWWLLESDVRSMVDDGRELQIFAGTIFEEGEPVQRIGDRDADSDTWEIGVPHGFFKIVIDPESEQAVGFLFDHQRDLEDGCNIDEVDWPSACIRTIEQIEEVTGLNFFQNFTRATNESLRGASSVESWLQWVNTVD